MFIRNVLAESPDLRVLVSYLVASIRPPNRPPFSIQLRCLMDITQSATVACAYFIAMTRMTPSEALATVRKKRGIVNMGFFLQLEEDQDTQGARERQGPPGWCTPASPGETWENVAEVISRLTQKDPNLSPAVMTCVSPSSGSPTCSG
jgi:hypothetical protein